MFIGGYSYCCELTVFALRDFLVLMRFVVLSNDAFEEAAIIANLSKQGTHTWVPVEKASASVFI